MKQEIKSLGKYKANVKPYEVWMGEAVNVYVYVIYNPEDELDYEVRTTGTQSSMFRFCQEFTSVEGALSAGVSIKKESGIPEYLGDQISKEVMEKVSKYGNVDDGYKIPDDGVVGKLLNED